MAVLLIGAGSATAAVAPDDLLLQSPVSGLPGAGAGQLVNPRGVVADPETGRVFVSDLGNDRISEFTAWGQFVRAWGWGVVDGSAEFQVCGPGAVPPTAECRVGIQGGGAGQFLNPTGLAIDANGNIYVHDRDNLRVQKFSPAGEFLLMFGGGVNSGTGDPNVCTDAGPPTDICGPGAAGSEDGQLETTQVTNYLAFNPVTNSIFIGDVGRIQEFNPNGTFKGDIDLPGETVSALAADPAGNLYYALSGKSNVRKISAAGAPLEPTFPAVEPWNVAVGADGSLYVSERSGISGSAKHILGFNAVGEPLPGMGPEDAFGTPPAGILGLATNRCPGDPVDFLYVNHLGGVQFAFLRAYGGSAICFELPPPHDPVIEAQYATAVDTDAATLKADVNPHFWPDTTYYVEYGTSKCSEDGCTEQSPASPAILTTKSVRQPVTTAGVGLSGLEPGTTYHYRFVAESGGGGPVFGLDPDGDGPGEATSEEGLEGTFRTFLAPQPLPDPDPCPNAEFRNGASARLPDCRAYELVSPLEKNNGDVVAGRNNGGFPNAASQASTSGARLTYSTTTAFGDPEAAPFTSQHLARRDPDRGWLSEAIAPLRTTTTFLTPVTGYDNEFKAFSADLCTAWVRHDADPPLAPGADPDLMHLYARDNCASGGSLFETLTSAPPAHLKARESGAPMNQVEFQGASADGSHAIFVYPDNLVGTGAPNNANKRLQLYEHVRGEGLRFVCVLPNGNATTQACWAGSIYTENLPQRREGIHRNAISSDGSRIYWTEAATNGPGRIFVRVEGEEQSRRVSQTVSGDPARFWGASRTGDKAIFTMGEALYSFDLAADASTPIATGVTGVMGVSEDAAHVYFGSTEALAGSGENSEGDVAVAGKSNLYLYREGEGVRFIATLSQQDFVYTLHQSMFWRAARTTPNGNSAVFISAAPLTGYDNRDAETGEPAVEVFRYDAEANDGNGALNCVSCNPSGARPRSGEMVIPWLGGFRAAAMIPGSERPLYASRVLSDDGNRLFFESFEALVQTDTNGVKDVYQWEAPGKGGCSASSATFTEEANGCVTLISSGQSSRASTFLDASPSGEDVFFATASSLVPWDYGLVDIYDAKVGGGFSGPEAPAAECDGEACQNPPAPPEAPLPATSVPGPADPPVGKKSNKDTGKKKAKKKGKAKKGCAKGKGARKGKAKQRCKRAKKSQRRARTTGNRGGTGR